MRQGNNRIAQPETAEHLIMRIEKETGCRVDDNGGDNAAMSSIFGMMARALGQSSHSPRDDVAAGILLRHKLSPEGQAQEQADRVLTALLSKGVCPDDILTIQNKLKGE